MLKFGKKPPVHTPRSRALGHVMMRALDALGAPPVESDDYYTAVESVVGGREHWGMLGNDDWGDCVEADDGHYFMLRTANAGTMIVPTPAQALSLYSAETGFDINAGPPDNNPTDQGTDETSDCQFMVSNGFLGHKAAATGPIDYQNTTHIKWTIQLLGACKIGFAVQQAQRDQYNKGTTFEFVAGSPIVGLHDIPLITYYSDGSFDGVCWGRRVHCAPNFVAPESNLLDEAHGLVFPDWIRANGNAPPGFNLTILLADLAVIEIGGSGGSHRQRRRHHRRQERRRHEQQT